MQSSAGNEAIASASAVIEDGRAAPEYRTFRKLDHRLCLQSKLDRRHFRNGAEIHAIESGTNAESQQNQILRKLSTRRRDSYQQTIRTVALSK